jgi:AraC-like DNA-binding protein
VGQQILRTLTVFDAVSTASDTMNQITNIATYRTVEDGERLWWFRQRHQAADTGLRQLELASIAYMIEIVRLGAGPGWRPGAIFFKSDAIPGIERLEQFTDADVRWRSGKSGIAIPRSLLPRRVAPSDPPIACATDDLSAFPEPTDTLVPALRQVIRSYLFFGHPRVDEIADATGLSVRALQRRLAGEGMTFKRLVDQTRFLMAKELMRDPDMPLIEIAHDLGYGDQTNFNHAFRRWAGVAPSQYRRQLHPE